MSATTGATSAAPMLRAIPDRRGRRTSGLDGDASVAGADQQEPLAGLVQPLVDGLPGTFERAVVVDDENAAGREPVVEVLELVFGGGVPVGVEAQERDALGCVLRNGL